MDKISRHKAIEISNQILADAERERLEMDLFYEFLPLRRKANLYTDGDPDVIVLNKGGRKVKPKIGDVPIVIDGMQMTLRKY
jgi:hypothetical protein